MRTEDGCKGKERSTRQKTRGDNKFVSAYLTLSSRWKEERKTEVKKEEI